MWLDPAREVLNDENLALDECYELCRQVHKAHGPTYYFATRLFPAETRRRVHALYAFMRYADEIVDNPGNLSLDGQLTALEGFEQETISAIAGESSPNPVLRAYADTVRECGIDEANIRDFLRSMRMDTGVYRYPTYEDLQEYTYGSAAVVGLMMCRAMGVEDERAGPYAEALGVAMQLTNFLRDVQEDWCRGRVYIPLEDLKRFGYAEEELADGIVDERFVQLMRFEIERARRLYEVADKGVSYIPRGRRYPVIVARQMYAAILDRIEAQDCDVFSQRITISLPRKLRVAAMSAAREPAEILYALSLPRRVAAARLPVAGSGPGEKAGTDWGR